MQHKKIFASARIFFELKNFFGSNFLLFDELRACVFFREALAKCDGVPYNRTN